jgi:uncharacterized protein YggE
MLFGRVRSGRVHLIVLALLCLNLASCGSLATGRGREATEPRPPAETAATRANQAPLTTASGIGAGISDQAGVRPGTVTLVADGVVRAEPDIATLTAGVTTRGRTARQAQDENTAAMAGVIAAARAVGVANVDIRTVGIGIHPVYLPNGSQIDSYNATNSVQVIVRDIKRVGEALDTMITAGANQIGGVQFGLKDDTAARHQALTDAVRAGRARADVLAAAAGTRVATLESMVEESLSSPRAESMASAPMAALARSDVPVQTGQVSTTARVRLVYRLQS